LYIRITAQERRKEKRKGRVTTIKSNTRTLFHCSHSTTSFHFVIEYLTHGRKKEEEKEDSNLRSMISHNSFGASRT